ncbi:MAG: prolyl oligopeptidase family serine peptidase [Fibrobacteria bacterium]|nr:prolyl oligopeptidase family serine peptidase [Fibrobacteria bacterium]
MFKQLTHALIVTLFIIVLLVINTQAGILDKFSAGIHNHKGTITPIRLLIPANYDSTKKYPLLLHLHGAGWRGNDNISQIKDDPGIHYFSADSNQAKYPAFILAPQLPSDQAWVDYNYWEENYVQDNVPKSNELAAVEFILDSLIHTYSIDTNRLYAYGESMGGFGTWDMVTRNPNKFAATIAVVGTGDPSKMHLIKHMGIWGLHGNGDEVLPVSGTRKMMNTLNSLVGDVLFTNCNAGDCTGIPVNKVSSLIQSEHPPRHIYSEFQGVLHILWATYPHEFEGMNDWLFSFSKPVIQPNLKHVDVLDTAVAATASWTPYQYGAFYKNSCMYTDATKSSIEFTFTGIQVRYIGALRSDFGYASIYIDDIWVKDIDCYNYATLYQQMLFESDTLQPGEHKIKIEVKGTKNAASSNTMVLVDKFEYFPVPDSVPMLSSSIIHSTHHLLIENRDVVINQKGSYSLTIKNIQGKEVFKTVRDFPGRFTIPQHFRSGIFFLEVKAAYSEPKFFKFFTP